MGAMVYVIFGSCKDITIGPTALMALMTHDYVLGRNADFAILLAFLSGCLQLLMACLRLGKLKQISKYFNLRNDHWLKNNCRIKKVFLFKYARYYLETILDIIIRHLIDIIYYVLFT